MIPTKEELDALRELAGKASPGPWCPYNEADDGEPADWHVLCEPLHPSYCEPVAIFRRVRNPEHDAAYVAAAHPAMIAHLLKCEAALRELVAAERMRIAARAAGTHDGERMDLLHKAYKRTGEAMVAARALTGGE